MLGSFSRGDGNDHFQVPVQRQSIAPSALYDIPANIRNPRVERLFPLLVPVTHALPLLSKVYDTPRTFVTDVTGNGMVYPDE